MSLKRQVISLDPSVKDALFRRIMREEDLAYLRDDDSIVGFEVDLDKSTELSGFMIIAIQKHTLLVFKSDLDEELRLILFPSMGKLFDPDFQMLDLYVDKKEFKDSSFDGRVIQSGTLREVVYDLTPPVKQIELPPGVVDMMTQIRDNNIELVHQEVKESKQMVSSDVSNTEEKARSEVIGRDTTLSTVERAREMIADLREQKFTSLSDIVDYVQMFYGFQRKMLERLVESIQSKTSAHDAQIEGMYSILEQLFVKLNM